MDYDSSPGPFYVTDKFTTREILFAEKGVASAERTPPLTLTDFFSKAVASKKKAKLWAVEWPEPGMDEDGKPLPSLPRKQWKSWTYKQGYDECRLAARGFIALGFEPKDACAILGFNSPWCKFPKMSWFFFKPPSLDVFSFVLTKHKMCRGHEFDGSSHGWRCVCRNIWHRYT